MIVLASRTIFNDFETTDALDLAFTGNVGRRIISSGARRWRHWPHVPTSPYDNVHTSHAHTEYRIPVPGRPCTLTAPSSPPVHAPDSCGSPTQTRVRAHGRWDLSVLQRAAPARPQRPTGTIQHTERRRRHTDCKVLQRATHLRPMSLVAWSVPNPSPFSLAAVPPPFH